MARRARSSRPDWWRSGAPQNEDYSQFPVPMPMTLRRPLNALGAARDDQEAGRAFERNFRFLDAPIALVQTLT